jgi:hypothetical protein
MELDFNAMTQDLESGSFAAPAPAAEAGQPAQSSFDPNMVIQYKASGKDLSEPLSTVIQRAQRGYDYAQLVSDHKQREAEAQSKFQQAQEMAQKWQPYHEYAEKNPEWADHVRQQWENRLSNQQPSNTMQQPSESSHYNLPPEVAQKISRMEQFIEQQEQQAQMAQRASEDQALATEIEQIRKSYPDIDFGHTDPETGESLEARVLRHAQDNRIFNFEAAFKHYYFDKLLDRQVLKAKEDATKALTQANKSGFLASGDKPMLSQNPFSGQQNKHMSYHQAMDVAARELGF